MELCERAKDNLECFRVLITHANTKPWEAKYYIASHALELALKAFLATSGVSKEDLASRKFGHKILKIFHQCEEFDLPHVTKLPELVERFQVMNNNYDFRYPTGYELILPKPPLTIKILDELMGVVRPIVQEGYENAYMEFLDTGPPLGTTFIWED